MRALNYRDDWEATFNADGNSWSLTNGFDEEQTIDYVMAMKNPVSVSFVQDILFDKAEVKDHVIDGEDMSFSEHNAIEACLSFIYG